MTHIGWLNNLSFRFIMQVLIHSHLMLQYLYSYQETQIQQELIWNQLLGLHHRIFDVSQRASYEITLVRLSVCPSIRLSIHLSLSLLKTGSIFSSDFVHHDSCLVTDKASFFKKIFWWTEFGPSSPKSGPKWVFFFSNFIDFGS